MSAEAGPRPVDIKMETKEIILLIVFLTAIVITIIGFVLGSTPVAITGFVIENLVIIVELIRIVQNRSR